MFAKRKILAVCMLAFLFSCTKSNQGSEEKISTLQSIEVADTIAQSGDPKEDRLSPEQKFIRTADIRFRVKDVFKTTHEIEDITAQQGGFVTLTNLTSSKNEVQKVAISVDSSQEITHYTVENSITLRVPNRNLDSVLRQLSNKVDYLDFRVIKADDVALQILANTKSVSRNSKAESRLGSAIDAKGRNLSSILNAEEALLKKNQNIDEKEIANLSLSDQVNFSTVNLSIYQRQIIRVENFPSEKDVAVYTPGFATQLKASILTGWNILEMLLVNILKLWPLLAIAGLVLYLNKRAKLKRIPVTSNRH